MEFPTLDAFIESHSHERDKLIQMGIIRSSRDQALVAGGPKVANHKGKNKDKSPVKKEQSNEPSSSKRSKKNGKGKTLCSYCGRGFHPDSCCMKRQIDEMTLLLKKHNIIALASTRKVDQREETKYTEDIEDFFVRGHALKASFSTTHTFLVDSGDSNHMVASRESFSYF